MAVMSLVASDTAVVVFGLAAAIAYAALAAIVCVVVSVIGDGDPVADVQHHIELTEAARRVFPPGPLLSDPEGETSAALGRFLAGKEEARQALWASRPSRTHEDDADAPRQPVTRRLERRTPCVSSSPGRAAQSAAGSFHS
jgi:hypothetical protein